MSYRLFLPSPPARDAAGMPLVIMLHGCHQDADELAKGTGMNVLAESKGYAVVYPEQSLGAHARRCWTWYDCTTQRGGADAALIAHLIRELLTLYQIDPQRIYVCGISAGAAMAHILALHYPELIAAVGMHCGPVFGACRSAAGAIRVMQHGALHVEAPIDDILKKRGAAAPMPAILLCGDNDQVVRSINGRQLERQFLRLNQAWQPLAQPPVTKAFGRTSSATRRKRRMLVRDYRAGRKLLLRSVQIEGLGHAWSGGDESVPFHAKGPSASRLMLDFFSRHRRLG
ncbi:PHB depolymerase family esterase [Herbaspirillum sp. LeCh32-8]|nr:PHB depolymerase family esterase [Herbaspirillum sp. LeCh32-8]